MSAAVNSPKPTKIKLIAQNEPEQKARSLVIKTPMTTKDR